MKIIHLAVSIAFALMLFSPGFAQVREIQGDELRVRQLESDADSLLRSTSHREVVKMEYFDDRAKPGVLTRSLLDEVQLPDKRRTVEEQLIGDKRIREERIWADHALFVKIDGGEWKKYSGGSSSSADIEQGRITTTYRFIGKEALDGHQTDRYEVEQHRLANKYSPTSPNGLVEVHFIRKTIDWFLPDGKLLKKQVENELFGRAELSRETTTYEYEPKDLKIEAPIK
jgi:hypothetical protein